MKSGQEIAKEATGILNCTYRINREHGVCKGRKNKAMGIYVQMVDIRYDGQISPSLLAMPLSFCCKRLLSEILKNYGGNIDNRIKK